MTEDRLSEAMERTADRPTRMVWVPYLPNPKAPTQEDIARGVDLTGAFTFTSDPHLESRLPSSERVGYEVRRYPGGMDVIWAYAFTDHTPTVGSFRCSCGHSIDFQPTQDVERDGRAHIDDEHPEWRTKP